MAFPAFLDTCTLFGAYWCDTLLRLAEAEAFRRACPPSSRGWRPPESLASQLKPDVTFPHAFGSGSNSSSRPRRCGFAPPRRETPEGSSCHRKRRAEGTSPAAQPEGHHPLSGNVVFAHRPWTVQSLVDSMDEGLPVGELMF